MVDKNFQIGIEQYKNVSMTNVTDKQIADEKDKYIAVFDSLLDVVDDAPWILQKLPENIKLFLHKLRVHLPLAINDFISEHIMIFHQEEVKRQKKLLSEAFENFRKKEQ